MINNHTYSENFSLSDLPSKVILQEAAALSLLADSIDIEEFQGAINLLLACRGRIVVSGMGKSGHLAQLIAATLSSVGSPAFYLNPAEAAHGDLGMVTVNDVIIILSNSGATTELTPLLDYCSRYNIPIVAITSKATSPLGKAASATLLIPAIPEVIFKMPSNSLITSLSIGHVLAVALAKAKNFTLSEYNQLHPGGAIGHATSPVSKIMHIDGAVPLLDIQASMSEAVVVITSKRFGCVGIVEENRLVGIITDGDLRRHLDPEVLLLSQPVREVMTPNPCTIGCNVTVEQAISLMNKLGITQIFVADDEHHVLGIIHLHDCLRVTS